MDKLIALIVLCSLTTQSSALWCYQCVSNQPGCGTSLNWLWHWTKVCPEDDDVCVKVIEEKNGNTLITRDCLSSLQAVRTDIPADHYEGCRPAAVDLKLGHYVNNLIKELDIHRDYFDKTTWCFCFLDHRCNSALSIHPSAGVLTAGIVFIVYSLF